MNRNGKIILFILSLVSLLALAACSAAPVEKPAARTINVSGEGEVTLIPDLAYVNIGVRSQNESVTEALKQNNTQSQAVVAALQSLGIDVKDIQTSNFNIYPQQEYGPKGELLSTTYRVDNTVNVTVRDLQIIGKLLDSVVKVGANTINNIRFDAKDKSKALSEARRLAVENGRLQAEELAKAANVKLGDVKEMNLSSSAAPVPMYASKMATGAMADSAEVPVSAGQMIIKMQVSLTYEIK